MTAAAGTVRPPLDDAAAWQALTPLLAPYLPWSSAAMRPAGLVMVLNELWFHRPALVVELGSGVSTIVVARLLRELGTGRLLTVEHDDAWADRVQRQLECEGLADLAAVVRASLRPPQHGWHGVRAGDQWYDDAVLAEAFTRAGQPIDVLVVDGPPAWQPGVEHARYPALRSLAGWLAPGATIVLDDIERAGEQAVLARWRQEHGVTFAVHPAAGVGIGSWPGA